MATITFISTTEAANVAGVSVETIRQLCKIGTLRYQKRGQLYYPCKEDVNRYADSISKVHSIRRDIERYAAQIEKDKEALRKECETTRTALGNAKLANFRLDRMVELMFVLLQQYEKEPIEDISEKDLKLIFMMVNGDKLQDIGDTFEITKPTVTALWTRILRKIAHARNEIKLRDKKIEELTNTIQMLDKKKVVNKFTSVPQEIIDNIDQLLQPINTIQLSNYVARGLIRANMKIVYDLVQCERKYIKSKFAKKSFDEIEQWMHEHSLTFGMTLPNNVDIYELKEYIESPLGKD
jgi:excisionase family DNA binding protein